MDTSAVNVITVWAVISTVPWVSALGKFIRAFTGVSRLCLSFMTRTLVFSVSEFSQALLRVRGY